MNPERLDSGREGHSSDCPEALTCCRAVIASNSSSNSSNRWYTAMPMALLCCRMCSSACVLRYFVT